MHDDLDHQRVRLIQSILQLPAAKLVQLEQFLKRLDSVPATPFVFEQQSGGKAPHSKESGGKAPHSKESGGKAPHSIDWPHAPLHRLSEHGTYMVTAGTLHKQHFFRGPERLDLLQNTLLTLAKHFGWQLEAWAVFSNHYHFIGHCSGDPESGQAFIKDLHSQTATELNRWDHAPGRIVWHNYWDTKLTFERSYLARLNYVHQNPVRHGLVAVATGYRWCSAGWFEQSATPAQVKTIYSFKTDKVRVQDEFEPVL